jgi:DnaJ-class molecular chaperone
MFHSDTLKDRRVQVTQLTCTIAVLYSNCRGSGSVPNAVVRRCSECDGRGRRVQVMRLGTFITEQVVGYNACGGRGEQIAHEDRCRCYGGSRITRE